MNGIVCFLPETGIEPYLRSLCSIGKSLSEHLTLLHCTGQMRRCVFLQNDDKQSSEEKMKRCKKCHELYSKAKEFYSADSIELSEVITEDKLQEFEKLVPIELSEVIDFSYKGIPVGKLGQAALVLEVKFLNVFNLSNSDIKKYRRFVLDAMLATEISDYICRKLKPRGILAFNAYAVNQAAKCIADAKNIPFSFITTRSYKGADFSSFMLAKRPDMGKLDISSNFTATNSRSLLPMYVQDSWNDSFFRFYGKDGHIFSNSKQDLPEDILLKLGFDKTKKTVVAFTSSYDERIAANISSELFKLNLSGNHLFETQIEWIAFLKDYAKKHKDIQIVVRVHPREGTRQSGKPSEHLLLLQDNFAGKNTENFVIIWADDPISSYDLIEVTDLCLISWSSMGAECARIGIPVLTYTSGLYYVDSKAFHVAKSIEEYRDSITNILDESYSFDVLTDGVRYNYCFNHISFIDCGDTIPHDFYNEDKFYDISPEKTEIIKKIFYGNMPAADYNKRKWMEQIGDNTEGDEKKENLKGISDFYHIVFVSKKQGLFARIIKKLAYLFIKMGVLPNKTSAQTKKKHIPKNMVFSVRRISGISSFFHRHPHFSLESNNVVCYSYKGRVYRRWSPLLYKMGIIYKEQSNQLTI